MFPFLVLHYEQLGLSGRQIGVLAAVPPLVALFAASLWGGLADATQQHHRLLNAAIAGTILSVLAISLVTSLAGLVLVVLGMAFFIAPIMPLVDNSALETLGDRKNQYGKLRLWGAVGWGLVAPVVGWLVEQFGLDWSFYSYILLMFCGLIVSFYLPITRAGIGQAFWQGFRVLTHNRQWLLFLAVIFCAGVGSGALHNYLFLYMTNLGAGATLMGLALTVATLSELVIYFFSDRLLDRLGIRNLLMISILALIVRLLAYSFIQVPWLVLPLQLLHGLTFSARWVAGVAYTDRVAPPGMGATAQGIFSGVLMGLANAAGALIGGFLYQSVGTSLMFRWVAIGVMASLILVGLAGRLWLHIEPIAAES